MKSKKIVIALQMLFLALWTCCSDKDQEISGDGDTSGDGSEEVSLPNDEDDDIDNSSFSSIVKIVYNGTSVSVDNPLPDSCVLVSVNGADVVVDALVEGVEYYVSGSTADGQLKIYSENKLKLTLAGVSITNVDAPAIDIQSHKRVFVVLENGTDNQLTDGSSYTASSEDQKAAFFSEGQLIFSGDGSLALKGNYKHALCSDDYVRITTGDITVIAAVADGVHVSDAFLMEGGSLRVSCVGDAVQSENTATVTGGTLSLATTGDKGHALVSESDMTLSGGDYTVKVSGKASKGLKCDGNLLLSGGVYDIETSGTGMYDTEDADVSGSACIKCAGTCSISGAATSVTGKSTGAGGKGMSVDGDLTIEDGTVNVATSGRQFTYGNYSTSPKGIRCESNLTINGGQVTVAASGGEGSEGIESKKVLTINGGTVEVTSYDDGINAKSISINGGYIYSYASQNDGIDANGTLSINGGVIVASGTSTPEEGLDCDQNTFSITGGTLIGTGGATSTPTLSACKQYAVVYGGSGTQGNIFRVENSSGEEIITYAVPRTLSAMTYLFSTANLAAGSYTIYMGGSVSGGTEFHGLYIGATYTRGSATSTSFTVSSIVTTSGSTSGGMGGNPGGGGPRW